MHVYEENGKPTKFLVNVSTFDLYLLALSQEIMAPICTISNYMNLL